ncbi:MAG: Cache 3/Cache 2 fusion domain-containing protein [Candidatus Kapaibacteriota bacterium]
MGKSISFKINSLVISILSFLVLGNLILLYFRTQSIIHFSNEELQKNAKKQVTEMALSVYNLAETSDDLSKKMLKTGLNVTKTIINRFGSISIQATQRWTAVNQFTMKSIEVDVPLLIFGGVTIPKVTSFDTRVPIVDEVTNLTGATSTIFVKMNQNGDMLRIATTVKKKTGERGVGTYIPAKNPDGTDNPVVSTILQDKDYYGRAFVVDQWYVTAYTPLKLANGQIVGMVYVGIPQKTVEERLRKVIYSIKIGETGYVYVLGGSGKEKGSYIISKEGKRDGENIWESKDANGKLFIQEIINETTAKPGEAMFFRYDWKNPEDPAPRTKLVAAIYHKDWDWVIGAGTYEDEIYMVRDKIADEVYSLIYFMIIVAAVSYLVTIFVSIQVSRKISQPVIRSAKLAELISRGDFANATKILNE